MSEHVTRGFGRVRLGRHSDRDVGVRVRSTTDERATTAGFDETRTPTPAAAQCVACASMSPQRR
jgi:hypothetical protein